MLGRTGLLALLIVCTPLSALAQRHAPWRFGVVGGASLNAAGVGYALWGPNGGTNPGRVAGQFLADVGLDGSGLAPYAGLMTEYASTSWWGLHARLAYDDRTLAATDELSYMAGGRFLRDELTMRTRYVTIDPRLRITPVPFGGLFFTIGAGASIALSTEVDFVGDGVPSTTYALPQALPVAWSLNVGAGYDIMLNEPSADIQWRLSPFLDASWMFKQRSADPPPLTAATSSALTTFTARAGVSISRGVTSDALAPDLDDDGFFITITAPPYATASKVRIREIAPIVPSVFIAPSDTVLPTRYRIKKLRPQDSATSYYDVISVAAQLLNADPTLKITLIGSDPIGEQGIVIARMVYAALVKLAPIDTARIQIKAQRNPNVVSGSALTPSVDRAKADIENRRVDLVLSDPSRWPDLIVAKERQAVIENGLLVTLVTDDVLQPWSVTIIPEGSRRGRTFGPFHGYQTIIPDAMVPRGTAQRCTVEVTAQTVEGVTLTDRRSVTFTADDAVMLHSERRILLFHYGEDDPVQRFATQLEREIAPRITDDARVVVHGHTDDIGSDEINRKLSYQYASGVARVLRAAVDARKVDDVEIIAVGHGEDATDALMNSQSPEGRSYNRAVIIEIIFPTK